MDEMAQEKKNGMGGPAGGHTEGRKGGPVRNGEITRRGVSDRAVHKQVSAGTWASPRKEEGGPSRWAIMGWLA
jgi:hypothetical protein